MTHAFTKHCSWTRQATIGFLGATTPSVWSAFVAAFEQRLRELGWINGSNVAIDYRWAEGCEENYAKYAAEFVRLEVNVIVTSGTAPAIAVKNAVKNAKSDIPIVFAAAGDPVGTKLVATLEHPGDHVTGLSNGQTTLAAQRFDKFYRAIPSLKRVHVMGNVNAPNVRPEMDAVLAAVSELNKVLALKEPIEAPELKIETAEDIVNGIQKLDVPIATPNDPVIGLYVCTDPLITTHSIAVNTLAVRKGLPTMHAFRDYVVAGGLMSYGPDFRVLFQRAAKLVDKILRGAMPENLPVGLPDPNEFELVINRTTARALGLRDAFLTRSDEVADAVIG